ncbi:PrpR N-terminal domain-containing protein [Radiobacillus kanasensis]|uniref:sigma-54-dependent transcriptional regulator n=1 Tax=Radiobacillus kanasensis TaxID=2844358 RepID=UPI001E381889|nr:sigma-54-dependent transcriptional regulator [Radiobacillus kanasensis]UFT98788.1 PrpR N-terminal domain-containing protein [Radiobacillus kanasensis]
MENINVLVVAPYPGLVELIYGIDKEELKGFQIHIERGDLEESLNILKKYEKKNIEFIISRGGTADLLRKFSSVPVIDIQVSGYDILRILTLLKGYQSRIEMIGFSNVIQNFESVSSLLDMDISYRVIHKSNEVESSLKDAKDKGAQIIVGDTITVRLANEHGLQGVLITSGKESVLEAFHSVKQMYAIAKTGNESTAMFRSALSQMKNGAVITNKEGNIQFINSTFQKILKLNNSPNNLFESFPFFKRIKELKEKGLPIVYQIEVENGYRFNVDCGIIRTLESSANQYLFELTESTKSEKHYGLQIVYSKNILDVYPQMIMSERDLSEAIEKATYRIESSRPVTILGEKGIGRRIFVSMLADKIGSGTIVEVEINHMDMKTLDDLIDLLMKENTDTFVYFVGIEKLTLAQQNRLVQHFEFIPPKLVFSFISTPELFSQNNLKLDVHLLSDLLDQIIYFTPLREREEFVEYVHMFLVQNNQKYGKQIVGIRPKALELLKSFSWNENFIELSGVMEEIVKNAKSEFIEENDITKLIGMVAPMQPFSNNLVPININQPLEDIEYDIIQYVLEKYQYNKSKTAEHLEINRATLWRKLNK